MVLPIQKIIIKGLYGHRDIEIPIREGRIVIVGRNGLGKTTVVNIIYLALSQQWDRLLEYDFQEIQIEFLSDTLTLKREFKENLRSSYKRTLLRLKHKLPSPLVKYLTFSDFKIIHDSLSNGFIDDKLISLSDQMEIPSKYLIHMIEEFTDQAGSFNSEVKEKARTILTENMVNSQVLYLPTYRRIEKDLKLIVPDLDDELERFHRRRRFRNKESARTYVELVEFGMEDVGQTFRRIKTELSESSRTQLNNLAGSYLRDVIRGEGDKYDPTEFINLDKQVVSQILGRVEESTLNEQDKNRLQDIVLKLPSFTAKSPPEGEKYIAHYFAKLLEVHRELETREKSIRRFISVCNNYLTDKEFSFDSKSYTISINLPNGRTLNLKDLSSGEKQIVSLFSHLYLHEDENFVLLIDEPELSLSVPWQKQLLPDIWGSERVSFLIAVTHSPFIFENQLDPFSIDLAECITESSPEVTDELS